MRDARLLLTALLALAGCDTFNTVKVENPVFGPPPPRLANTGTPHADETSTDEAPASSVADTAEQGVRLVHETSRGNWNSGDDPLSGSQVVATVDGAPIFASEVLEPYGQALSQAREQASDEQFRELRDSLIRKDLDAHVERKLLVQSLRSTLQKEQIEMLEKHLDQMFAQEIRRLMGHFEVNTKLELEQKLQEQQTSLSNLQTIFTNQRMAMEYLAAKSQSEKEIGRRELFDYYQEHLDEYSYPAEVKWQQIIIRFHKHGGKQKAFETVLKKAVEELREGADFGDVARRYSDGPTARNGGHWGWTKIGSLADGTVEEALFELPLGTISQVFVGNDAYQLVKVIERKEAGATPFGEVQDEIKEKIEQQARQEAAQKVLTDLRSQAIIESAFIEEEEEQERRSPPLPF